MTKAVRRCEKEVRAFLSRRESFPDRPAAVRLVETHCSYVALTARHAWKVKKPVNFGFLDFSTLEKRRHFCEVEVEINRQLSPGIYLAVVPICRGPRGLAFGSAGRAVEYAVKMRRLPERCSLLRLVERGEVATEDIDRLVEALSEFYRRQKPSAEIVARGRVENLKVTTDQNFQFARRFLGETISLPAFAAMQSYTKAFYRWNARRIRSRMHEGRILDCHGDLHLGNITVMPSRIAIFDRIEFNDRFRFIDVASDAAFLAMDLDFHGRRELGRHFVEKLSRALADPGMPGMIDFYKCSKAYVRGNIESLTHFTAAASDRLSRASRERASRYFRLALKYAIAGSRPLALVVMGLPGSGKSALAQALGEELGWKVLSSDRIRKAMAGVPPFQRGSRAVRRRLYGEAMTGRTYRALIEGALAHLREGSGIILDATFGSAARRAQLIRRLERGGFRWRFVQTRAAEARRKSRLRERNGSSGVVSDARIEDFDLLKAAFAPPREVDRRLVVSLRTEGSISGTLTAALNALASLNARSVRQPETVHSR